MASLFTQAVPSILFADEVDKRAAAGKDKRVGRFDGIEKPLQARPQARHVVETAAYFHDRPIAVVWHPRPSGFKINCVSANAQAAVEIVSPSMVDNRTMRGSGVKT